MSLIYSMSACFPCIFEIENLAVSEDCAFVSLEPPKTTTTSDVQNTKPLSSENKHTHTHMHGKYARKDIRATTKPRPHQEEGPAEPAGGDGLNFASAFARHPSETISLQRVQGSHAVPKCRSSVRTVRFQS